MDNETKEFLVQLFDVRFAEQDKKIESRFAEQDKKIEARFAEQDRKIESRFAEQDKKIEAKFAEQDKKIESRFAEQDKKIINMFEEQNEVFKQEFTKLRTEVTGIVGEVLEAVDTRFKRERKKTDKDIKNKIALL